MKSFIYSFIFFFSSQLYSQQCSSNAGIDKTVCGGKKVGSNYRVYLDGSDSYLLNGSINYKWSSLDDGISFSNSQSRRAEPYFNYPQSLNEDKEFRIQLRVYDEEGSCESFDTLSVSTERCHFGILVQLSAKQCFCVYRRDSFFSYKTI